MFLKKERKCVKVNVMLLLYFWNSFAACILCVHFNLKLNLKDTSRNKNHNEKCMFLNIYRVYLDNCKGKYSKKEVKTEIYISL